MNKSGDDAGTVAADPDEPVTAWGARRALIRQRSNYRRLVLVTALFGTAAGSYPVTVLSASRPRIADDLGARDDTIAWVLAAPLLAFAVVTPIVGKVGDLYGHRRTYLISFALGAGATFVARTIDVDATHMQQTLRRAHAHQGTAFVEILQNCPVYNDNEWLEVEDRKQRAGAALVLEDDEALVWGPQGSQAGIRIHDGVPSVIELSDDDDAVAKGVAIHHERHETPAYAFALASLQRPAFPLPIGVFRAVDKPSYGELLEDQVATARNRKGEGDLADLLHSGDTWEVSP